MEVTQSQQGVVAVLRIKGPIIANEFDPLDARVEDCFETGRIKIVLDISDVPFIDSEGLDKILALALKLGKQGGDARVASPNPVCRDIFAATGVDGLVQIFVDSETAVKSLL